MTGTAVVGRTHFKAKSVSLALLTSSTSLLSSSKNFLIQRLPVLESIITGQFLTYYLQLCNIVSFLFLTLKLNWQLFAYSASSTVFRF